MKKLVLIFFIVLLVSGASSLAEETDTKPKELLQDQINRIEEAIQYIEKGERQLAIQELKTIEANISGAQDELSQDLKQSEAPQSKNQNTIIIEEEEQQLYPRQTKVEDGHFEFSVYGEPVFKEKIGGTFGESAGEGAIFLLVPVKVKNITNETRSVSGTTSWEVHDLDRDLVYESFGDSYLLSEYNLLDTTDIPPGLRRKGYLVFEIDSSSQENRLVLEKWAGMIFQSHYYFAINFS